MWRKGTPGALLVGGQIGAVAVENSMEVAQKIKNIVSIWPRNSISGYLLEENKKH